MQQNSDPCYLSAVIPVYNDKESLQQAIPAVLKYLEKITPIFELIIAEDASTDGSFELASEWAQKDKRIRVFHRDKRLGRGSALNNAAWNASGEIFCYFDVDLATDMIHLSSLIQLIRDGNDIAIGSRLHPESTIIRSIDREFKSQAYNFLVRFFLRDSIIDHQCGFKAFRRDRMLTLLPYVRDTHWFWDTELLVYAKSSGYRIAELPVIWKEGAGTTVMKSDIFSMGYSILELWFRLLNRNPLAKENPSTEPSGKPFDSLNT